jgi:hypothetical protein
MSNRLLTLLTEIERALIANDPSPDGGAWDTLRLVNFHQGLARLTLSIRSQAGLTSGQGIVLLQDFTLADGTQCVKASLSWQGVEKSSIFSIYSKPALNWHREAGQIAAQWLDGHVAAVEARVLAETDPAGPLMSAAS